MKWTGTNDVALLHIMLEIRKEGKVIPGGFTSEGWGLITKEMQTKFGSDFSKDKLKSYKKWYSVMNAMLNLSGFGWYEERKKVTAEAVVWDDYIAVRSLFNL
ncbi:L10-interacting MYB domain-containing protein [Cinnamomum micranthum f. kanehirae]|uniref:L10-interacting MYB domain-containing protein n=1 Tax=Cinnamomum micranthum f. kanehirae TaxID=337451 RepID=A0A3S3N6M6_9MAGN|nr:L10-interacting MYB domain-containing protein [Cinnamomum micranthum f. kanehirae]